MQWVSKSPSSYPDTLICENWVPWSETALNQQHDASYTVSKGFQNFVQAENADERTRAGELFNIGLLRGRLISERGGSMPYGWKLVQENQNVHTRLGYLAYIVGKAICREISSPAIERAFNILCTIFTLQIGFKSEETFILTAALFNYLLDNFVPSTPRATLKWRRYLAAAMFCTLETKQADALVNSYITGQSVNSLLLLFNDGADEIVEPDRLVRKIDENMSLGRLVQQKSSLYWIGEGKQGFYTRAALEGSELIRLIGEIERECLARSEENPFGMLLRPDNEDICVLEQLDDILKLYPTARNEWRRLVKTLREGVTEALNFLERVEVPSKRVFYGHDIETADFDEETLILEIERGNDEIVPLYNEVIVLGKHEYVVQSIDDSGDRLTISVKRVAVSSQPHSYEAATQS